jgi:hypothetical protein
LEYFKAAKLGKYGRNNYKIFGHNMSQDRLLRENEQRYNIPYMLNDEQ